MPTKLKISAIIAIALALLFSVFFDTTKHNPFLSAVNPFAEDPYDAIGSFALQAVILLGFLALFRAFRPYRKERPSHEGHLLLVRTQITIVLAALVTLAGDLVALIRHVSLWSGTRAGVILIVLVIGFFMLSIALGMAIQNSAKDVLQSRPRNSLHRPVIISLLFLLVLFFYPERITESIFGTLFTVTVGATLLFMSVWAWGNFLSPVLPTSSKTVLPGWLWFVVILMAIFLGLTIVLRELSEGGGMIDFAQSAFIISVYIGLEVAGVVIGYAFLGKFLGIFQSQRRL